MSELWCVHHGGEVGMLAALWEFLFCPIHGVLMRPGMAAAVMALPLVMRGMWRKARKIFRKDQQ